MREETVSLRSASYRLRSPHTAAAALGPLQGSSHPLAIENVAALIWRAREGRLLSAAIRALPEPSAAPPIVREALLFALESGFPACRRLAASRLADDPLAAARLREHAEDEPSWSVRAAVAASPHAGTEGWLFALSDPHWRARLPAIRHLSALPRLPASADPRVEGALAYIRLCRDPAAPVPPPPEDAPPPDAPWWDPDPAVTRRELERLRGTDRRAAVPHLPAVLHLHDRRLRRRAVDDLIELGDVGTIAAAARRLADPRTPHVADCLDQIAGRLDVGRRAAVAAALCQGEAEGWGTLRWALSLSEGREHASALLAHPHPRVRAAAAAAHPSLPAAAGMDPSWRVRAVAAAQDGDFSEDPEVRVRRVWAARVCGERGWRQRLAEDPDAQVRVMVAAEVPSLEEDPDPRVRAAALTEARAAALWEDPGLETSWEVLARAAGRLRRPLSEIAPLPGGLEPGVVSAPPPQPRATPEGAARRVLGKTGIAVSPLGLSGHYGLDEAGFSLGLERGVNLLFWEPSYRQQARFIHHLPPARRDELVILSGSYDADPKAVRRDIDAALRSLKVSRVGLFLIFWVRSPRRIDEGVLEVLRDAQERGDVGAFGLSTHQRALACGAVEDGWPLVMTRHSGAHRGAEERVFPTAEAAQAGLITFSSLCYGRMLEEGVAAADCYRYSLSFPGVHAVLSAPRSREELLENLTVLDDPRLSAEGRAAVLAAGARLYRRNRAFAHGVRWR